MNKKILKYAGLNSFLTILYIGLVASILFYGQHLPPKPDTVFVPMMMLMLFVFSAAITGALILGRPIFWYLDGKKKEAVRLLLYTLSIFFVVMALVFVLVIKSVI